MQGALMTDGMRKCVCLPICEPKDNRNAYDACHASVHCLCCRYLCFSTSRAIAGRSDNRCGCAPLGRTRRRKQVLRPSISPYRRPMEMPIVPLRSPKPQHKLPNWSSTAFFAAARAMAWHSHGHGGPKTLSKHMPEDSPTPTKNPALLVASSVPARRHSASVR